MFFRRVKDRCFRERYFRVKPIAMFPPERGVYENCSSRPVIRTISAIMDFYRGNLYAGIQVKISQHNRNLLILIDVYIIFPLVGCLAYLLRSTISSDQDAKYQQAVHYEYAYLCSF